MEAWAGDTARYALIEADHVTWTWEGEAGVGYRLLDVTDAVQLRAVLESLFSRAYVEEKWQHLVTQEENYLYTGTLLERDGKLYANEKRAFDSSSAYQYDPASIQIMGVTEESISLQVKLRFTVDSTADRSYPLTLRRERGRWVLDGWENDGRSDNSYIRLPEELDARVAADPELGTRLRYVWALGEGLRTATRPGWTGHFPACWSRPPITTGWGLTPTPCRTSPACRWRISRWKLPKRMPSICGWM